MTASNTLVVLSDRTVTRYCRELQRLLRDAGAPWIVIDGGFDSWQREVFEPRSATLSKVDASIAFVLSPRLLERPGVVAEIELLLVRLAELRPSRTVLFANFFADPRTAVPMLRHVESTSTVAALNQAILDFASRHAWFHTVDQAGFCSVEGLHALTDARFEASAQMYFSPAGQKRLATCWQRPLVALHSVPRKVLVTDLDNTLWQGVVGEDGFDGIEMGASAIGWPHRRLQQAMLELKRRGVLLAVASKNNPDEALRVLADHPDCLLRPQDFVRLEIGWGSKSEAIAKIARELNLGRDACVFLDDSAFERAEVTTALPEVLVLDFPAQPMGLANILGETSAFDSLTLTAEDSQRASSYAAENARADLRKQVGSAEEFYRSLDLQLRIVAIRDEQTARVHQLVNKTNQFNLTTQRLSSDEVRRRVAASDMQNFALYVADKMGDSGLTGVAFVDVSDPLHWHVENFLLSCRVIGRTVEHGFLAWLAARARQSGVQQLSFRFEPGPRNQVAGEFLDRSGLAPAADRRLWSIDLQADTRSLAAHFISIEYQE